MPTWSLVLFGVLLTGCLALENETARSWQGKATVHNLKEIIIGRCYNYIRVINPTVGEKNCTAIWEAFQNAFLYKDPCNISPTNYEIFIRLAFHKIPQNKALFWENTKHLVHQYADKAKRMMPLGDTLIGYLADDLDWCGQLEAPGMNFQSCPTTTECVNNPVNSFWVIASESYARGAEGIVSVMLNGSVSDGTFPKDGFFAKFELPNWNKANISQVLIWVMDNVEGPDRESCGTDTVGQLEDILRSQNFNYTCTDNVRTIRILQCVDYPNDPACNCILQQDLLLLGLVLSLMNSAMASTDSKEWNGKGSTRNLKEIMMGRCFDYLQTVNPSAGEKDCPKIWESFLNAFSGKDPCNIRMEDYEPFLKLADHDIPVNQSIFWSRTKELLQKFSKITGKYMPLESTLAGYLADGLNWCGRDSKPGPDYKSCPENKDCENHPIRSFWRAASQNYAAKARGQVSVMLNGSASVDTFRNSSIFGEIELAQLDKEKVTSVHLWIMDNIDGPDNESCGIASVVKLESILKEKNLKFTCLDNYRPVHMIQCVTNPDKPSCKLADTPQCAV